MNEAMLKVTEGPLQGQAFPIKYREVTIGRSKNCKIRPSGYGYEELSREHARLVWDGAEFVIEDLDSRNGVIVDGQKIRTAKLHDGSKVTLGDFAAVLTLPKGGPEFADAPRQPEPKRDQRAQPERRSILERAPRGRTTEFLLTQIAAARRTTLIGSGVMAALIGVGIYAATRPHPTFDPGAVQRVEDATVFISTGRANGSGFLVDDKHIVTNRHVVSDESNPSQPVAIKVTFFSGTDHEKAVDITPEHIHALPVGATMAENFHSDLAVIDLDEAAPAAPVQLGDSSGLKQLQDVAIIGFPGGGWSQENTANPTSNPTVSVLYDKVQRVIQENGAPSAVQLGGVQTHGNSGGPIIDSQGNVVAVVDRGVVAADGQGGVQALPLSNDIPIEFVKAMLAHQR